jgi:hypothetical protein
MTHGAGSYTMDYSHDEPCPPHVQQEVIALAFEGHGSRTSVSHSVRPRGLGERPGQERFD